MILVQRMSAGLFVHNRKGPFARLALPLLPTPYPSTDQDTCGLEGQGRPPHIAIVASSHYEQPQSGGVVGRSGRSLNSTCTEIVAVALAP